jgi:thiamine biosynthesis protein ThiI
VLDSTVKMRILRPLLCYDKYETVNIAKKIDTFNASTEGNLGCEFVPKHPSTKCKTEAIEAEEAKLDIENLTDTALDSAELIQL